MNAPVASTLQASALTAAAGPQTLLRFLTCGSVDDGKSTLIGRMLYECGAVFDDQLDSLTKDSKKFGTDGENLDFALLVDGLSAEREQGITIDVAYRYFSTPRRAFIVADTPGHEHYTRNMATGASTADAAILLVDARKGILPQTRRHAFITSMLRVRHIIVAINKMDLVNYDAAVFNRIVEDFKTASAGLGFESVVYIPLAARSGDNVTRNSPKMLWYQGPSLLNYLEEIDATSQAASSGDFLFPVQWVNRPDDSFRGFSGTIAAGSVRPGDQIISPAGQRSHVSRIVSYDGDLDEAIAGQAVTLSLTSEIDVSRGDVLTSPAPLAVRHVQRVAAHVIWTSAVPALVGSRYIIKLATSSIQVRIDALHHLLNIEDFKPVHGGSIAMNSVALVTLALDKKLAVADYTSNKMLGGFILIDRFSNETAAIGMMTLSGDVNALVTQEISGATTLSATAQLRLRFEKMAGVAGSRTRWRFQAELAWRALTAVTLFVIAWAFSGNAGIAALIAAIDLIVRPLLYTLHRKYWMARWRAADTNDSGGGI